MMRKKHTTGNKRQTNTHGIILGLRLNIPQRLSNAPFEMSEFFLKSGNI